MSLTLRPYQPSDAAVITSWLKSEYLMRQWCADRYERYPVTPEDMNIYYERNIDGQQSRALTMTDGDDIVGYITLRTPADNLAEQRLGFVIVDDSKRGHGLGKALVSLAVKYAFEELGATKVSLGVFENNPSAIHCYESAGFHRVSLSETESYECLGETWNCIEMEQYNMDKKIYPRSNDNQTVYLKSVVTRPTIEVGDFTIYNDFVNNPRDFEKNNVLYHYPINNDRLIIGKFCSIACGAKFIFNCANHTLKSLSTYTFPLFFEEWNLPKSEVASAWDNKGDIVIGNDVWIGYDAVIMAGVTIGDGAIIGTRAVVSKDVEPYSIVGGVPAKEIRKRFAPDVIKRLLELHGGTGRMKRFIGAIPLIRIGKIGAIGEIIITNSCMSKDLKDMTLKELWELFPIFLAPHNPDWHEWAREEIIALSDLLEDHSPIINHIGSTAIPGIQAKPTIDILVEIAPDADWQRVRAMMEDAGYICMSFSDNRMSFNKGYAPVGYADKVFHVHVHRIGDNDEILFRDYLIAHPESAKEYEKLKLSLLPKYKNNRDGYTEAKQIL